MDELNNYKIFIRNNNSYESTKKKWIRFMDEFVELLNENTVKSLFNSPFPFASEYYPLKYENKKDENMCKFFYSGSILFIEFMYYEEDGIIAFGYFDPNADTNKKYTKHVFFGKEGNIKNKIDETFSSYNINNTSNDGFIDYACMILSNAHKESIKEKLKILQHE